MKRIQTQPNRRPTAACQPSIRHRTPAAPKAPQRTHNDVTILLPFTYIPQIGVEVDFIGWDIAVPQNYRAKTQKMLLDDSKILVSLQNSLPEDWIDVRVTRDETEHEFVVTAKRPIS